MNASDRMECWFGSFEPFATVATFGLLVFAAALWNALRPVPFPCAGQLWTLPNVGPVVVTRAHREDRDVTRNGRPMVACAGVAYRTQDGTTGHMALMDWWRCATPGSRHVLAAVGEP